MNYEKTNDSFLNQRWRFQIQMHWHFDWDNSPRHGKRPIWKNAETAQRVGAVRDYLEGNARDRWEIHGNNVFCVDLSDAFWVRLLFNDDVKRIREAGRHPLALAGRSDESDCQRSS